MAIYRYVWLCMLCMYGYVWGMYGLCMAMYYDYVCIAIYVLLCVVMYCYVWLCMVIYGYVYYLCYAFILSTYALSI